MRALGWASSPTSRMNWSGSWAVPLMSWIGAGLSRAVTPFDARPSSAPPGPFMSDDRAALHDIAEACRRCRRHIAGIDWTDFLRDELRQDATVRQLEIVGEAVKRLSAEFRGGEPSIPWKLIAGMRDKLIHDYDDVALGRVWEAATQGV